MGLVPGWNSISGASWWSNFYFWFGIVCLFLLGITEIVSHIYTLRKDVLVEAAESNASARRQAEQQQENIRREAATAELQRKATEGEQALAKLRRQQAPRVLLPAQQAALIAAARPFAGQKFRVASVMGDSESRHLMDQITFALDAAGWDHGGSEGLVQSLYTQNPVGIEVAISQVDAEAGRVPAAAIPLVDVLMGLGLVRERRAFKDATLPSGRIQVTVGIKPPETP